MKKLIVSICTLALSAAMLCTSTYAWFSMNKSVTAGGMSIEAKSESTYLLIGKASDNWTDNTGAADKAAYIQGLNGLSADFGSALQSLKPSAHESISNKTEAATANKWYTASAANVGASTIDDSTKETLTGLTGYVVEYKVYLTVAVGANSAHNLTVKPKFTVDTFIKTEDTSLASGKEYYTFPEATTATGENPSDKGYYENKGTENEPVYTKTADTTAEADKKYYTATEVAAPAAEDIGKYFQKSQEVRVLVVSDNDVVVDLGVENEKTASNLYSDASNGEITSTTVHEVCFYVYVDGNASNLYTNNKANLNNVKLELVFGVDVKAA